MLSTMDSSGLPAMQTCWCLIHRLPAAAFRLVANVPIDFSAGACPEIPRHTEAGHCPLAPADFTVARVRCLWISFADHFNLSRKAIQPPMQGSKYFHFWNRCLPL